MENHKCIFEKVKKGMIIFKGKYVEVHVLKCSCGKYQFINWDDCKVINLQPQHLKELGLNDE